MLPTASRSAARPASPNGAVQSCPRVHVLDVTDFYSESASGGVRTYLHEKARRLGAFGVRQTIVVPGAHDAVEATDAGHIHRLAGPSLPFSPAYRLLLSSARLGSVIEKRRPDVIEVGSPFIVPALVRRALAERATPLVGFYHADLVRTYAEPYVPHRLAAPVRVAARSVARSLIPRIYGQFDATIAASASVADELRWLGVPRVEQIPLGVDLIRFHPDRANAGIRRGIPGLEPDVPVGIFAGRFCAEKRLDVVLEGHRRMEPRHRPHLVLVGDGPHRARLEAAAARDPRLTVLPYCTDRDVLAELYASMDFHLAPGPGETFGLAIGEALASGLPVVVVARGAAPDRVDGSGASTSYRHGDADDAGRALARMVGLVARDREGLRARARAHAEATLDWNRTMQALVELYDDVIARRAR